MGLEICGGGVATLPRFSRLEMIKVNNYGTKCIMMFHITNTTMRVKQIMCLPNCRDIDTTVIWVLICFILNVLYQDTGLFGNLKL